MQANKKAASLNQSNTGGIDDDAKSTEEEDAMTTAIPSGSLSRVHPFSHRFLFKGRCFGEQGRYSCDDIRYEPTTDADLSKNKTSGSGKSAIALI